MGAVPKFVARPLIRWWLAVSEHSWLRQVVASDSPHVHSRGTNPDRVLVAGDGAATGRGVLTHDLGLPGYLARSLTSHTGRAADVDVVVSGTMTAHSCLTALGAVDLSRFDIILLSVGANEALGLTPLRQWRTELTQLVSQVLAQSPAATNIFLLPVPFFSINPHFPRALARVIDRHVLKLNAEMSAIGKDSPRVEIIPLGDAVVYEAEGKHVYQRWAEGIALRISNDLDPARVAVGNTERLDEEERQEALEELERTNHGADPVLDALTEQARRAFGTAIAAITLIRSDVQVMRTAVGMDPVVLPRENAFCDVTIRRAAPFVVENALRDSRYADYTLVDGPGGVRFYAGHPIESPNGSRVGAICVMDTEPRHFSTDDAALLRTFALTIQAHLWKHDQP